MAYRNRPIVKFTPAGKRQQYKNLARFNSECQKRDTLRGNFCILKNIRCLKDGGGLATVSTHPGPFRGRPAGTWRLHFADCGIMKRHLKRRVAGPRVAAGALNGARGPRRRKRR